MKRVSSLTLVMLGGAVLACDGATRGTDPRRTPVAEPPVVATLRATVDLAAGTLSFDPAHSGVAMQGSSAVSAAVYGNQGVTVRIYNSGVVVTNPSSPGKKRLTANVGVRNLLAYPIGDEQAGAAPTDTSGIFVFVNGGPTVGTTSSPCSPACSVTVANEDGRLAFNALNQAYWFWDDRLTAFGGARDTTLTRRSWSFEADTQVTSFTFDVLLGAAWPPPYQTRWKTEFPGDSLPHTSSEPNWDRTTTGLATATRDGSNPGSVLLVTPPLGSQYFMRRDSIGATRNAYMEGRMRSNTAIARPEISMAIDDDIRFVAMGISGTQAGFVTSAFSFIGTPITIDTRNFQTYRLVKFGADSAQLLINGVRRAGLAYAGYSTSTALAYSFFGFGGPGINTTPISTLGNSSTWDFVVYEIGATEP